MRNYKYIVSLVILFFLTFSFAQTEQIQTTQEALTTPTEVSQSPLETQWFGVSTGFPLSLNAHYGLDNLIIPDLDIRFNGTMIAGKFSPLQMILGISADALYNFDNPDDPQLDIYAGGGLGTVFYLGGVQKNFDFDIHGLVGGEYRFSEYGVFGEVNVGTGLANNFGLGAAVRIGFNYHFQ